jgi:hypothetical protein
MNDQALYQGRKQWVIFIWPMLNLFLTLYCFRLNSLLSLLSLVFGVLTVVAFFHAALEYFGTKLVIYNNELRLRSGIVVCGLRRYSLLKISGCGMSQSILGRWLNFGDVACYIGEQPIVLVKKLRDPAIFQQHLQLQLEKNWTDLYQKKVLDKIKTVPKVIESPELHKAEGLANES